MLRRSLLLALAAAAMLAVTVVSSADAARRHLKLVKSAPAADSVLTASPAAIELWFSEKVELGVSRVRLEGADAKPIALGALKLAAGSDNPPLVAPVTTPLANGAYTVHWTATSKDGHVVKGTFAFRVRTN